MRKYVLTVALIGSALFSGCWCGFTKVFAADEIWHTQIQMLPPPTNPKHVVTKEYADTSPHYDAEGDLTFPAGMALKVDTGGVVTDVLSTDGTGNTVLGSATKQINFYSSAVPTVKVGAGNTENIVLQRDLANYYTQAEVDADMAFKANLVGGIVPDNELPSTVKVHNWEVAAYPDLVTLTNATINDRAFVGDADPTTPPAETDGTYYLIYAPPTTLSNWRRAGDGSGASEIDPVWNADKITILNALDDKANASDLLRYSQIDSPAFQGIPTAPTPPASAVGTRVATAEFVKGVAAGYLPLTGGTITGSGGLTINGPYAYDTLYFGPDPGASSVATHPNQGMFITHPYGINFRRDATTANQGLSITQSDTEAAILTVKISPGRLAGTWNAVTQAASDSTTKIATTAHVDVKLNAKISYGAAAPSGTATDGSLYFRYGATKGIFVYAEGSWQQCSP